MGGISLTTNMSSLNTQRLLAKANEEVGKSFNRIASGDKIAGPEDGNVTLVQSESLKADVAAMKQGARNLKKGESLLKMAEGALNELSAILLRSRGLASQAANGTLADTERRAIDLEFQTVKNEIDRIVGATEYNGTYLLNGTLSIGAEEHIVLQAGRDSSAANQINLNQLSNLTDVSTTGLGLKDSELTSQASAFLALNDLTKAIDNVLGIRARVGTTQLKTIHAKNAMDTQIEDLTAAVSTIRDTDLAEELTNFTKQQLLVQSGSAMMGQGNISQQAAITLLEEVIV